MDDDMSIGLEEELMEDLKAELSRDDPELFDEELLSSKIKSAIREVYEARRYPEWYTEAQKQLDMERHYTKIRKRALYDYNQIGDEGQSSHSENGTSRNYISRSNYCGDIIRISE